MQILNNGRSGNGSMPCFSGCRERPWAIPTVDQCERGSAAHSVYNGNRVAWIALFPNAPRLGGVA
jgi:hypothetical protein